LYVRSPAYDLEGALLVILKGKVSMDYERKVYFQMIKLRRIYSAKRSVFWIALALVVFILEMPAAVGQEPEAESRISVSEEAQSAPKVTETESIKPKNNKGDTVFGTDQSRSGYGNLPQFGGPKSVGAQLQSDNEIKQPIFDLKDVHRAFKPYWNFKKQLVDRYGFAFGGDYNALAEVADKSMGENSAASGVFRFFGQWTFLGRGSEDSSTLVYKVENRHKYGTEIAPQQLAGDIGYAGLTAVTFSNIGWALTNFYWYQKFFDNHVGFVLGNVDVTDYVDGYGLVNAWTEFNNLAFTISPTIPAPNQGLGAALRVGKKDFYFLGGIADANGDPTDPGNFCHSFFSTTEYFKHAEFGWVSSWEKRFTDNVHVTGWHVDERKESNVSDGYGIAFSASYLIHDRWLPFVRFGISNGGGGAPLERSISVGGGTYMREKSDFLGVGFNWGRPSKETYGPGLRDQLTAEIYYRLMLFQYLTITPDVQLIVNPAMNPDADQIWVFGLRARLEF
jgi:porin